MVSGACKRPTMRVGAAIRLDWVRRLASHPSTGGAVPTTCDFARLALILLVCSCAGEPPPAPVAVQYADATAEGGLDFLHYNGAWGNFYYPETYGSGAAFFDADGDGWQDIYLVNGACIAGPAPEPPPTNRLYRNTGGPFVDVTAASAAGDAGYGTGCAAADYDNDGDQDLYVANYGPNVLLRNEGAGRFVDVTAEHGVGDPRWSSSCGFLDYDLDGDLDLFIANYVVYSPDQEYICQQGPVRSYCDPTYYVPIGDMLYRNDGDRFTDVTEAAGITREGRGLGVAFSDYDLDGDTDIYVANDGTMNFLYENRRARFVDVGLQAGVRYNEHGKAEAGMGVDFGDVDNDGDQDIFVTNFSLETNTLYRNDGQGQFRDATARFGLVETTFVPLGFSAKLLDYDNDGHLDIFVANGHIVHSIAKLAPGQTYAQCDQMLRNEGGVRFADVSADLGPSFAAAQVSRATAVADYDNDGDLDLLETVVAGRPRLLRNDGGNTNHWLLIHLAGTGPRDGIGARVAVTAGGRRQVKERQSGSSYLSSHDPRLHFGLGRAMQADVEIVWPGGQVQHLEEVAADQILRCTQPR